MMEFIKKLFTREKIDYGRMKLLMIDVVESLNKKINLMEESAKLMRHILGSIDLSDVRNLKPKTDEEQRNYDARMASVFFDTSRTADKLIVAQEEHIGMEVMNQDELMFARGTINGIKLIRDEFEDAKNRHVARNNESHEHIDARKLFPELNGE